MINKIGISFGWLMTALITSLIKGSTVTHWVSQITALSIVLLVWWIIEIAIKKWRSRNKSK